MEPGRCRSALAVPARARLACSAAGRARPLALALVVSVALGASCSRGERPPLSRGRPAPLFSDAGSPPSAGQLALADRLVADAEVSAGEAKYEDALATFRRTAGIYEAGERWGGYVRCLNAMAEQSRRMGRLDDATRYVDEALKAGLAHLGARDLEVARSDARKADILHDRGEFEEAIRWHTRALELRIALQGEPHLEVATSYAGRGNSRRSKGDFAGALADCNRALANQIATVGASHPDVGWTYNIIGAIRSEQGRFDEAFVNYTKALAVLRGAKGHDATRLAKVLGNLGSHYDDVGDYDRALASYLEALSLQTSLLGERHPQIAGTCNNIGIVYDRKGDYDRALSFYERAVAVSLAAGRGNHPHIASTYGNMGLVYYARKDYEHAIAFMDKARLVFGSTMGEGHPAAASSYNNLGLVYEQMGDYDRAAACHEKALAIEIASQGKDAPDVASSYNNLGSVYAKRGDYDRAAALYERALGIQAKALGPRHPDVASIYRNLGRLAERRGDTRLAMSHHEKALAIFRASYGDRHPEVAQSRNELGDVYRRQGRGREALALFAQAIRANRAVPREGSAAGTSTEGEPLSETVLLESLDGKARVLADRRFAGRDLPAAISTYEYASSLVDRIRVLYRNEGSKLLLAERAASLYERGIAAALDLYRQTGEPRLREVAFRFAEKGRGGVLRDALALSEARRFAGLPDALLAEERALRIDLAFYERSLAEERLRGKDADAAKVGLWQDKVFGLRRSYDRLLERLETDYPAYHRLMYQSGTASLADVQDGLPDDRTALVEYFVGAEQVFSFVVSRRGVVVNAAARDPRFDRLVEELRAGIVAKDLARYTGAARRLYELVVAPVEADLAGKSLIIVPDGSLSVVPFEALLTRSVDGPDLADYSRLPYLLHEHDVAYAYSATLFLQNLEARSRRPARDFAGLAPVLGTGPPAGGGRPPLPGTRREVTRILERVRGSQGPLGRWLDTGSRVYLGPAAQESVVKSGALAGYRFVHIATHGLINERDPRLSGLVLAADDDEDGVLHLGEVYELTLDADLVVLSACETGLGRLARGEGIIGLTRGFLYAGAQSVLVSLWPVADASTSDLMLDVYDGILRGRGQSPALGDAKRRLIRRQPEYAKPYHWAPFVLVGR